MTMPETGQSAARYRLRLLTPLIAASALNYLWQVPYAVHQYGWGWTGLPRLSLLLLASAAWLTVAACRFVTGRRGGRCMLLTYLAAMVLFYLLHNATGAFMADLPASNPILLTASILGYLNLALGIGYLWILRRRPAQDRRFLNDHEVRSSIA